MSIAKSVCSPLASPFKLSSKHCPTSEKEKQGINGISYASVVGTLMYAMVCTRPAIAYVFGVISQFLSNLGKEH